MSSKSDEILETKAAAEAPEPTHLLYVDDKGNEFVFPATMTVDNEKYQLKDKPEAKGAYEGQQVEGKPEPKAAAKPAPKAKK